MSDTRASVGTSLPRGGWTALALFVAGCLLVGVVGGISTASSVGTWYPALNKPSWNPPKSIFAPVWTLLYVTMAVSAWLVWRRRETDDVGLAMLLFGLQLALNAGWSMVFFGLRQPGVAALEIALLWLSIAATLWAFARVSKMAAWLLVPYLGWVSFAAALNFAIWRLNA
jgi:tryptophan-rich sensory protein